MSSRIESVGGGGGGDRELWKSKQLDIRKLLDQFGAGPLPRPAVSTPLIRCRSRRTTKGTGTKLLNWAWQRHGGGQSHHQMARNDEPGKVV